MSMFLFRSSTGQDRKKEKFEFFPGHNKWTILLQNYKSHVYKNIYFYMNIFNFLFLFYRTFLKLQLSSSRQTLRKRLKVLGLYQDFITFIEKCPSVNPGGGGYSDVVWTGVRG